MFNPPLIYTARTLGVGVIARSGMSVFTGIGLAISTLMLGYDFGNTNWKKTIPAVVTVAILRRKYNLV
jgi:uncharacterized protein YaaW (UPF0174 family)